MLQRFIDIGMPYFTLTEQCRMKRGLKDCFNSLFYKNQLQDHESMSVQPNDPSDRLKRFLHAKYPSLLREADNEIKPILINVPGLCQYEKGGRSKTNLHNIAFGLHFLEDLLACNDLSITPDMIGIATGYTAQMKAWRQYLAIMQTNHPGSAWAKILVGTTGFWQGKQIPFLIVDLVRAGNDRGNIGCMSDPRQLNVLISRQENGLIILGDVGSVSMGYDEIMPKEPSNPGSVIRRMPPLKDFVRPGAMIKRNKGSETSYGARDEKNKHMILFFNFFINIGHVVPIEYQSVYHRSVDLGQDTWFEGPGTKEGFAADNEFYHAEGGFGDL